MKEKTLKVLGFIVIYLVINILASVGYYYSSEWFFPILIAPIQVTALFGLIKFFYI